MRLELTEAADLVAQLRRQAFRQLDRFLNPIAAREQADQPACRIHVVGVTRQDLTIKLFGFADFILLGEHVSQGAAHVRVVVDAIRGECAAQQLFGAFRLRRLTRRFRLPYQRVEPCTGQGFRPALRALGVGNAGLFEQRRRFGKTLLA